MSKAIGWSRVTDANGANAACDGKLYKIDASSFVRVWPTTATLSNTYLPCQYQRWGIGTKLVFGGWVPNYGLPSKAEVWVYNTVGDSWLHYVAPTFVADANRVKAVFNTGESNILFVYIDEDQVVNLIEFDVETATWGTAETPAAFSVAWGTWQFTFGGFTEPGEDFYLNLGSDIPGQLYKRDKTTRVWSAVAGSFGRGYTYYDWDTLQRLMSFTSGVPGTPYWRYQYGISMTQSHDVPFAIHESDYYANDHWFFDDGVTIYNSGNASWGTAVFKWLPGISCGPFAIEVISGVNVLRYRYEVFWSGQPMWFSLWQTALRDGTATQIQIVTTFGGVAEYDSGVVAVSGDRFTFPADAFTGNGDGNRVITVTVWDVYGDSDSYTLTQWVDADAGGGGGGGTDVAPPHIILVNPTPGATLKGDCDIVALVTDETALGRAELHLNGVLQHSWTLSGTSDTLHYVWETLDWDNGSYTVQVKVWDSSDNMGQASVTCSINNAYADSVRVLYTKLMPIDTEWTTEDLHRFMEGIKWDTPGIDPRRQYAVRVWFLAIDDAAKDTLDLSQYKRLTDAGKKTHVTPTGTKFVRWAFDTVPMLFVQYFSCASEKLIDAVMAGNGKAYVLGVNPNAVYEFNGATLTKKWDVPSGTPVAIDHFDGEVCVALGNYVHFIDPDVGESTRDYVPNAVLSGATITDIKVCGDYLYVATIGTDATEHRVYKFQWRATKELPSVTVTSCPTGQFALDGDTLLYCVADKIYNATNNMAVVRTVTGETLVRAFSVDDTMLAGMASGSVQGNLDGSWVETLDLGTGNFGDVVFLWDRAILADHSTQLWSRALANGEWGTWRTVDLTDIERLFIFSYSSAVHALVAIGQKSSSGRLMLLRQYQPDANAVVSGLNPPNFCGGLAQAQGG